MYVICPLCGKRVYFRNQLLNQQVTCPKCDRPFLLEKPEKQRFGLHELSGWMLAIGAAIWLGGQFVAFWFGAVYIFVLTVWLIGWTVSWGCLFRLSERDE